jgi:CRISPR/Cas system-associated exonuclease Cas4 (RecB family)
MQEAYSMPHAHYQREHNYLTKILSRLAQAEDFCLSYAKQDHYRHYYPSPMLEQIFPGAYHLMSPEAKKGHTLYSWTYLTQEDYTPISPQRITVAQINHFLQCPFKGFVRTLTGAQAPIKTLLPIDPATHGRLIHQYLQDRLAYKNENHALELYTAHWSPLLREVEKNRLDALYDQVKAVFEGHQESLSFEYKVSFEVDQWRIEGRVDIWDFDKKHVYDIKSKNFIASSWFSHHPADCQGPLYALGLDAHSLGVIRLTQPDIMMNREEVEPYYTHWSSQLKELLLRWSAGNFDPQPQHIGICHHCSLKKACRYENF